jgi:hypothetical protein
MVRVNRPFDMNSAASAPNKKQVRDPGGTGETKGTQKSPRRAEARTPCNRPF